MKKLIVPIPLTILQLTLIKKGYLRKTCSVLLFATISYIITVVLNRVAIRKKKDAFRPIHRLAYVLSIFKNFVRQQVGDICEIEEHIVKTNDGYLLKCHRVFLKTEYMEKLQDKSNIGKVIYGHHSFMSSSETQFRIVGKYCIEKGFDVWLNNMRGNSYSMFHENPNISEEKFFDFGFEEYASDVKPIYDYIIKKTGKEKIIYIGYSLGGLCFSWSHSDPENCEFFKKHTEQAILFAPALFGKKEIIPENEQRQLEESLVFLLRKSKELGIYNYFHLAFEDISWMKLSWLVRGTYPVWNKVFQGDLLMPNREVDNCMRDLYFRDILISLFPLLTLFGFRVKSIGHGTSIKCMYSFFKFIKSEGTYKTDYGKESNLKKYGTETPPLNDFTKISTKITFITGSKDQSTTTESAERFSKIVNDSNQKDICKVVEQEGYKHVSFIAPKDRSLINNALESALN